MQIGDRPDPYGIVGGLLFSVFCRAHSGARSSPKKNTATVTGPAWDAMIVPISQIRISPAMCGKRARTASRVISAYSRQLEWQIQHLPL